MPRKCEALNREGERCHFAGSKQVGTHWFCGNHATKALKEKPNDNNHKPIAQGAAVVVAEAIHKLYISDLGSPEVVAAILRNVIEKE